TSDPYWVPPLIRDMRERIDPQRHPFYDHGKAELFLARRNGRVVGRIAAAVDETHNSFHDEKTATFGFIEFEHDPEVAAALFARAAAWGEARGMELLRGPLSYTTNEECGTLVKGFDSPPVLMMPYNPAWHEEIYQCLGFEKGRDLLAYYLDRSASFDRLKRLSERAIERYGLHVRPINLKRFKEELETIRLIYNDAWKDNWGFVPMDRKEFSWHARQMKQVLVPGLALIVEVGGKPAGFSLSLPDYHQVMIKLGGRLFPFGLLKYLFLRRRITGIRVMAMGIRSDHRSVGAEGVLISQTIETGLGMGYDWGELSWVLEDNRPMRKLAENMGAEAYKRYRIWEAPIQRIKRCASL
ncbi:MAG: N-acetyltransferase, partial [Planctomycetes bacterium]|nr:N-acetyltransferase [Planctomycetota bacterium]